MLHFPVPRPTGPPASPWRASPEPAYDQASPTRSSSSDKNLPALPQQDHGQILSMSQSDISREASSSNGSKGGFKWWWKGGKKEAERRKSLGIGSSRTSYHVDELSSGLQGVTIGNNGPRASSARSGNLSNSLQFPDTVGGNIHTDPSGRKRTPPPPPIPPRPEYLTPTSMKTPATSSPISRTSPTKLYRKYDPPPIQVPAPLPDLCSSPTRSSRPQESGTPSQHMHHSRSQPTLPATQAQQRYSAPQQPYLSHSSTTPELTSLRPISGSQPPHSQGPRTPHEYRSSALSPTHRDNLADSARYRSPPSSQRYDKLPPRFQPPTTPKSNRTSTSHLGTPASNSGSPARPGTTGTSRQCSGFTRLGRRCKRMVKTAAPYAALVDGQLEIINEPIAALGSPSSIRNDGRALVADAGGTAIEEEPRYCRDHVKQICEAEGFYWKGQRGDKWIRFSDWIPDELEEQSKVLLRLTMESALTSRECEGYIYAYELRDLQTDTVAYYKVGRTDNVTRRLDEWKKRCTSHHPTLRDIFPLHDEGPGQSMLTGAMRGGIGSDGSARPTCPAVKRLERLVHIEMAAHSAQSTGNQFRRTRYDCLDCQTSHQEIFPITRVLKDPRQLDAAGWEYEQVVKTAILRWEAFVREIMT